MNRCPGWKLGTERTGDLTRLGLNVFIRGQRSWGSSWIHAPNTVFFSSTAWGSGLSIPPWLLGLPNRALEMFLLCSFIYNIHTKILETDERAHGSGGVK